MPELPDVEGWKRYVARHARGKRVRAVRVHDQDLLRNTSPQGLGRALHGSRIGAPRRHGKWLVVPVGDGRLLLHFGMTGTLRWVRGGGEHESTDRVVLALDGGELRVRSQRKLGGVWWLSARGDLASVTGPLGPDATRLSRSGLRALLAECRGSVKAALMDQQHVAGLGNELVDEILWRAGIAPGTPVRDLNEADSDRIHRHLRAVLRESVKHGRIPSTGRWLAAVRGVDDPRCPRCDTPLERARVSGRTTLWCPRCQGRDR